MTLYGWYSEEAFLTNKLGYLYSVKGDTPKLCTIISTSNICPYYQPLNAYKENIEFVGELDSYIQPVHYKENIKDLVNDIYEKTRLYEIYKLVDGTIYESVSKSNNLAVSESVDNRIKRFNSLRS